ncbi:hypothetical protein QUF88_14845 [Bacillus sp. DX1.1]|uniref:hypothetical protein n=1 Tax=unclassified Bacillus (in: firmicutes) TaxID=185979 RepID=UPI0025703D16|nr:MULTISPECIES: hypothetical protein [unclassified Bacillus (in: firmicutes)]MDM5155044.1 hypothetical protein [Bacillus sp. DX1.1]WJE83904.1 hypothetical protein QRE67_12340 [Bacillus sp. DX3.1]
MLHKQFYTSTLPGNWDMDIKQFFTHYDKLCTYEHSFRVANEARKIARRFNLNEEAAGIAGYLQNL